MRVWKGCYFLRHIPATCRWSINGFHELLEIDSLNDKLFFASCLCHHSCGLSYFYDYLRKLSMLISNQDILYFNQYSNRWCLLSNYGNWFSFSKIKKSRLKCKLVLPDFQKLQFCSSYFKIETLYLIFFKMDHLSLV